MPASTGAIYPLSAATAERTPVMDHMLARARAFAEPLIADETLDTGENTLAHADAVASIVASMGGSEAMQAASYLVYSCQHLNRPYEVIAKVFGDNFALLAVETTKLIHVQKQARSATSAHHPGDGASVQTEKVRKMLLAFSRDLRVVMLRLASRLQTLRHAAASRQPVPESVARESLQVFAPLANRLGIWQVKWEIEDLSFRFLEPDTYQSIARLLDEKRIEREEHVERLRLTLEGQLHAEGIEATVQGRPKNIYSIVKKMRGKSLDFAQVLDILALRVVVADVAACYAALACVHSRFQPLADEFDDYIARPKSNGYQSLHTVVRDVVDGAVTKPIEIQIRTVQMHQHAEHGVAAHWAYKEAGSKGYAGVWAGGEYDAKIAVLRQLLAWERDLSEARHSQGLFDDRIYVLTPDAAIVELPQGATAVDFAYTVHTTLGHRCRGARIDGAMVPLNTPLHNGQTIEIVAAKEGGPSRDWLNADLGYLVSHRARAKVRAWFNAPNYSDEFSSGSAAGLLPNSSEDIFAIQISAQSGTNELNTFYSIDRRGDVSIEDKHLDQYESADERGKLFTKSGGQTYSNKYDDLYGNVKLMRVAEMYLVRAEANFRAGTALGATPLADINRLRTRAGLAPLTVVTLPTILRERKLELAFEGFRLGDVKRNRETISGPDGKPLAWNSPRLVFPIPLREINVNPNLVQNEGYN